MKLSIRSTVASITLAALFAFVGVAMTEASTSLSTQELQSVYGGFRPAKPKPKPQPTNPPFTIKERSYTQVVEAYLGSRNNQYTATSATRANRSAGYIAADTKLMLDGRDRGEFDGIIEERGTKNSITATYSRVETKVAEHEAAFGWHKAKPRSDDPNPVRSSHVHYTCDGNIDFFEACTPEGTSTP